MREGAYFFGHDSFGVGLLILKGMKGQVGV